MECTAFVWSRRSTHPSAVVTATSNASSISGVEPQTKTPASCEAGVSVLRTRFGFTYGDLLFAPDAIAPTAHQNVFAVFAAVRGARDAFTHAAIAIVAAIIAVFVRTTVQVVITPVLFVAVVGLLTVADWA